MNDFTFKGLQKDILMVYKSNILNSGMLFLLYYTMYYSILNAFNRPSNCTIMVNNVLYTVHSFIIFQLLENWQKTGLHATKVPSWTRTCVVFHGLHLKPLEKCNPCANPSQKIKDWKIDLRLEALLQ